MFIHWGLYSVLGGVYQGKRMEEGRRPRVAEWIMHAFNIPRSEYKLVLTSTEVQALFAGTPGRGGRSPSARQARAGAGGRTKRGGAKLKARKSKPNSSS